MSRADESLGLLGRGGANLASTAVAAMTDAECWARLRYQEVGRVAVCVDGQPLTFPVNFAVGDMSIVFRTAPGSMMQRSVPSRACFEIDHYDHGSREGWSVLAIGKLEDVTNSSDPQTASLRTLPVQPLAPGSRPVWIALRVDEVSGRKFTAGWLIAGNWLG